MTDEERAREIIDALHMHAMADIKRSIAMLAIQLRAVRAEEREQRAQVAEMYMNAACMHVPGLVDAIRSTPTPRPAGN